MPPGGRIRDSDIEEVRERTDLVQLVSEYVPLKKSGREFRGPCPFHKEKDPSFYVNPAKGVYHCFGCKASGGLFNFVMQIEGLSFSEAVERLADRLGYQLHYEKASPEDERRRSERDTLFKLNQTAAEYYHYLLVDSEHGEEARKYLEARDFGGGMVERFQLGYAPPGWRNLTTFLSKKGFDPGMMVRAGLARQRSGGGSGEAGQYDIFRDRVMFPISDHRGRVVAFGGRRMPREDSGDEPKYLNSPETPVYRKAHTLYGLFETRNAIQDADEAVVVEGYTDLLGLYQAGVENVVATLGTALTENHFDLLNRFCDSVYLAFDADRAGVDAALRALELYGKFDIDIFVVTLPEGEDPASVAEKGGAEEFSEMKQKAEPILDFALRKTMERFDTGRSESRRKALKACVPILSRVSREEMLPVRNELVRKIGTMLNMPAATVEVYLREASRVSSSPAAADSEGRPGGPARWDKVEREALRVLMHNPDAFLKHLQYLDPDYFQDEDNKKIFELLKEIDIGDEEDLQAGFDRHIRNMFEGIQEERLRTRVARMLTEPPPESAPGDEDVVFDRLGYMFFLNQKSKKEAELLSIDKKLEPKKYESLCNQVLEIEQVIKELYPYDHE